MLTTVMVAGPFDQETVQHIFIFNRTDHVVKYRCRLPDYYKKAWIDCKDDEPDGSVATIRPNGKIRLELTHISVRRIMYATIGGRDKLSQMEIRIDAAIANSAEEDPEKCVRIAWSID